MTPDEPITEYVPTQILAEAFRAHGYDGIVYRSLLGEGLYVALFDGSVAELINCGLYETNGDEGRRVTPRPLLSEQDVSNCLRGFSKENLAGAYRATADSYISLAQIRAPPSATPKLSSCGTSRKCPCKFRSAA